METNDYGNVDVRDSVPDGYVHVEGLRLTTLARKLGIDYAPALVGFSSSKCGFRPTLYGIVIRKDDEERFLAELAARDERSRKSAPARARAQNKRIQKYNDQAFELGVLPGSRTHLAYRRGDIDRDEAMRIGDYTARRHECSDYDELLKKGYSKEDARTCMTFED